uniref:Proteasome assembly chaperone 1 n=1 Tax=Tabanus bromius TaxID=304241 RepID=A0A0K8TQX4_TABBR
MDFGEIVEPSSRAFWDDFEEVEDNCKIEVELQYQNPKSDCFPTELDRIIIIEGSNILEFLKATLIKGREPTCRIKNSLVTIYHFEEYRTIVCISEENDLNLAGALTELLEPWLKVAKKVVTISIQPKILYKGEETTDMHNATFIRGINSTLKNIPELETPNFITGLSAGAASWRYCQNMSISSYLAYVDSPTLDTLSTEPILKLLNDLEVKCDRKYVVKSRDQSHVYM